jgi:hypothetical protein
MMNEEYPFPRPVSMSAVYHRSKELGFTRKMPIRIPGHLNYPDRLRYLEQDSFIDPHMIIDIDETPANNVEYCEKYGYAIRGERAVTSQILIGNQLEELLGISFGHLVQCWR